MIQKLKKEISNLKMHSTTNITTSDEYVQPENKQDQFDWKLTKVRLKSFPKKI